LFQPRVFVANWVNAVQKALKENVALRVLKATLVYQVAWVNLVKSDHKEIPALLVVLVRLVFPA
jgi:hypothetical protein